MTEDHAGLLRVLADLAASPFAIPGSPESVSKGGWIIETLHSATKYVRTVLRDPKTGFFAGSQDADEAYFAKPLEERRTMQAPFVDKRSYSNWTAALAGAFFTIARAFENNGDSETAASIANEAQTTLDAMYERLRDADGLLFHVASPTGEPSVRGLFTDQIAFVRALVDAHEYTREPRFLERAIAHADATIAKLASPDGGFYDHIPQKEELGNLAIPDRPIADNGLFAEALLRLALLSGETRFSEAAEKTLLIYAKTYEQAGSFAATYARAIRRYLTPALCTERGCI